MTRSLLKYKIYPDKISPLYVTIACLFVSFLLITNVIVGRLVQIGPIMVNGDYFPFPLTYIFGDILTEVYGFKRTRLIIWLGFLANIIMAVYFYIVLRFPYPKEFMDNKSFMVVLGSTPLIVFASISAYFLGEFSNSVTLSVMKKITKGRHLWTRTIGSTLVGQAFDTVAFVGIAFASLPFHVITQLIIIGYISKVTYEIIATPLTYFFIKRVKEYEKLDTYDYKVIYNPFELNYNKQ